MNARVHVHTSRSRRVIVGTAMLLVLGAGGAAAGPGPFGSVDGTDVQMADVERVLEEQLEASGVPGASVVVVSSGEIQARGAGSDGASRDVSATTPFVLGSTTKSFTALAVMQLVDSGDVELDASVRDYVPEFSLASGQPTGDITVRHLLQHTSGLSDLAGGPLLASAVDGTALEAVAELEDAELTSPPGGTWLYANANYVLAGLVVERASGMSYADYVQAQIFDPLGMSHSFVRVEPATADGLSKGHRFWFGVPVATGPTYRNGVLAAGYLISTAEDLGRYLSMYLAGGISTTGERVVSTDGVRTMLTPGPVAHLGPWADGMGSHYGMGWFVGGPWSPDALFHPGNSPDSSTMIAIFPDRDLAVATLMNAGHELPVPGNPAITDRISSNVIHAALGQPVPDLPSLWRFYLVFDLVVLALVGSASWALVRSVRALSQARRRSRPSHPARPWAGVLLRTAGAGLLVLIPFLTYGWRGLWTWAPDLTVAVAALILVLASTAALRLLVQLLPKPGTESPSPANTERKPAHVLAGD
jgi:CubicO group peptidase (beta-lactamase class C family)